MIIYLPSIPIPRTRPVSKNSIRSRPILTAPAGQLLAIFHQRAILLPFRDQLLSYRISTRAFLIQVFPAFLPFSQSPRTVNDTTEKFSLQFSVFVRNFNVSLLFQAFHVSAQVFLSDYDLYDTAPCSTIERRLIPEGAKGESLFNERTLFGTHISFLNLSNLLFYVVNALCFQQSAPSIPPPAASGSIDHLRIALQRNSLS